MAETTRHRKYIIHLYILAAIIALIGIGILLTGVFVSLEMLDEIEDIGRDLCVLRDDSQEDWGNIPGTRKRGLRHQFHIFEAVNPRTAPYGDEPISRMYGPFILSEERTGQPIEHSTAKDFLGWEGDLIKYKDDVELSTAGRPVDIPYNTTFDIYNYETFTMLYSHRMEDDWMYAAKALSGMINYTTTQFLDQLIIHQMREDYYETAYKDQPTFTEKRLDVFKLYDNVGPEIYSYFWHDPVYGLKDFNNTDFWGGI